MSQINLIALNVLVKGARYLTCEHGCLILVSKFGLKRVAGKMQQQRDCAGRGTKTAHILNANS